MLHAFSECTSVDKLWKHYFNIIDLAIEPEKLKLVRQVGYSGRNNLVSLIINLDLFLVRYFIKKIRDLDLKHINHGSLENFLRTQRQTFSDSSAKYRQGIEAVRTHTNIKLMLQTSH